MFKDVIWLSPASSNWLIFFQSPSVYSLSVPIESRALRSVFWWCSTLVVSLMLSFSFMASIGFSSNMPGPSIIRAEDFSVIPLRSSTTTWLSTFYSVFFSWFFVVAIVFAGLRLAKCIDFASGTISVTLNLKFLLVWVFSFLVPSLCKFYALVRVVLINFGLK